MHDQQPIPARPRTLPRLRLAGLTLLLAGALASPLSLGLASAQDATPTSGAAMMAALPTVSVSGHGEVNVPPDTASVNIGVDVIQPTLSEAQAQATAQATAVIDALKAEGIADEEIQTDYFSVNILRDYSENADPTQVTGFEIINQLRVTVRDTESLGDLLDAVVTAGANNIYGVSFYVDDQTAAASEARVEAVADARTKAEELADAAGMTLGPVVAIAEGVAPPVSPLYAPVAMDSMEMKQATPVEAGSTTISVDVQVTYALQ